MPDFLFNPKDGFEGPDVPEVEAPDRSDITLPEPPNAQRKQSSTFILLGCSILAVVGVGGAFLAWLLMTAV
jgi:hypothetical protein